MRLRRWLVPLALGTGFLLAAALPVDSVSQSTSRIASVFLGLFAASILPTVSILMQSLSSSSRSVQKVDDLHAELQSAIDSLFRILGVSGIATIALLGNSIETPAVFQIVNTFDALERIGNGAVGAAVAFLVCEAGKIPSIIRRSLSVRLEVAKEEARQRTRQNTPTGAEIKSYFGTKEGFGRVKELEESQNGK